MRVLVAIDKFKDCLSANAACAIAAAEIRRVYPDWEVETAPLADGGDGFAERFGRSAGAGWIAVTTTGPRGQPVEAGIVLLAAHSVPPAARALLGFPLLKDDDPIAIVEMASASGLALLPSEERDPWMTTTQGTGVLLRRAAALGARGIVLGVGGSATNDLGLGALSMLGFRLCDRGGAIVEPPTPRAWKRVASIFGALAPELPSIRIACDVRNPLFGPDGATAVFGPQKGLQRGDIDGLEAQADRMARLLCAHCAQPFSLTTTPGAGAAGGLAFGLLAAGNAQLVSGFDLFSAWFDLGPRIARADLVLTGEGRFDASSLSGKGPGAVVARAAAAGKRVVVLAGSVGEMPAGSLPVEIELRAISPPDLPLTEALPRGSEFLAQAVRAVVANPAN